MQRYSAVNKLYGFSFDHKMVIIRSVDVLRSNEIGSLTTPVYYFYKVSRQMQGDLSGVYLHELQIDFFSQLLNFLHLRFFMFV